ncbi:hypothetical protein RB195_016067 [Necator americanus]|uniref:Uncharacterized protein n=1 Tax=Necator americanus TaxID=51031 RepID=A0ABR1EA26_NECAM
MLGGRNICFYILVLYVLSGAFGLRCYIGRFFEVIKSTTASEKFCAVYIALDCTGGPSGYFDRGYADVSLFNELKLYSTDRPSFMIEESYEKQSTT